jgi:hypothetical protein
MPERIQLRRTKGWRKPGGAIVVARPSRWGNPYREGDPHPVDGRPMSRADTIECFRLHCGPGGDRAIDLEGLRGRDLACWCRPGAPCHADALMEWANGSP